MPIPGTQRPERAHENAKAAAVRLDAPTLARIDAVAQPGVAQGTTLLA
ncbi:MAG: hypothetical protein U1E89_15905 [Burkholderiaceae bacterium]